MFTIRLGQVGPVVMLAHPDLIKEVFTGDPEVFHAGQANVILRPSLGGHSVLLLDDAHHMRQRKLLLPPFHGERMQRYGELMRESPSARSTAGRAASRSAAAAHAGDHARGHPARRLRRGDAERSRRCAGPC